MELARQAATAFGQTVLLKGHRTVVTDGQRNYINQTGDSTLSKAGAGDVLSGIIGCLLASRCPPTMRPAWAVFARPGGELAGAELGKSRWRRDVLGLIPAAISEIEK